MKDPDAAFMKSQVWCSDASSARGSWWAGTLPERPGQPLLTPYMKNNSKWISDLDVRAEVIELLGKNTWVNLHDLGSNGLLDMM